MELPKSKTSQDLLEEEAQGWRTCSTRYWALLSQRSNSDCHFHSRIWREEDVTRFFNIWVFPLSRHLADSSSGPLTGKTLWFWQMSCERKWMNDGWCSYAESVKNSTGNLSVSTLYGEFPQWSNHFTSCRGPPWCISCITCDLPVKES